MAEQATTDIVVRTPQQELVAQIRGDGFKEQIAAALPANVTPDRFVRATVTALMQNPDLATKASADSLFTSVIRCAQDGLLPDGREAALVIFVGKAAYLPMVGGFRKIAAEHGWGIRSAVVYANDEFEHEAGLEPRLLHRPVRPGAERGAKIAAYAIAVHRDGRKEIELMTAEEIGKVRAVSRASDRGPWVEWEERMWEKTPVRRLFAKLPLDPGDRRVARMLDASELGPAAAADLLYGSNGTTTTPALPPAAPATPEEAPADVAPVPALAVGDGQQAEGSVSTPSPAEPSAPGSDPGPEAPPPEEFAGDEPADPGVHAPGFQAPADPAIQEALRQATEAGQHVIGFGKYAGLTVALIAEEGKGKPDPGYVLWMAGSMQPRTDSAQEAQEHSRTYARLVLGWEGGES